MSELPMMQSVARWSTIGRRAVSARDWQTVNQSARQILSQDKKSPEGWFLRGLTEKAAQRPKQAMQSFSRSLKFDPKRYDAAVELADLLVQSLRHGEAVARLKQVEPLLSNSPLYLDRAAHVYSRLGLHERAWPLYDQAVRLQPDADRLKANLAANSVLVGKLDVARNHYLQLLEKHPDHQRNHFELARAGRARDSAHVDQMKAILAAQNLPPEKNIFMYFALGKELEDLEQWQEAFDYYQKGGTAASRVASAAGYSVDQDIAVLDRIIEVCNESWLTKSPDAVKPGKKRPVFIVGLPRTGTTLTERILASHSQVESADESFFLQMAMRKAAGHSPFGDLTPEIITSAAGANMVSINRTYLQSIDYRLGRKPVFIDKYPLNFQCLGFIARAFPDAGIVHLRRNPMDACFAMFKQSYFKFAYTLEDLGRYYRAYHRLSEHWARVLGDRVIDVHYESLVADIEPETRRLLSALELEFEPACLEFHRNRSASATASAAQIREKAHTRSVNKWLNFSDSLEPLASSLEQAGIPIDRGP